MLSVHEWSKIYYENKKIETHNVLLPNYWFAEGIGYSFIPLSIDILGSVNTSNHAGNKNHAKVFETEFGFVVYRNKKISVVKIEDNYWRYYGLPDDIV